MIRLSWRQMRWPVIVAAIGLAALAVLTALSGPHLAHLYHQTVTTCGTSSDCTAAFRREAQSRRLWLGVLVVVLPGILGAFWGAPLVAREFETGTYRLAWTQSVTRGHWLTVKLGVVGLATMATAGLASLIVTWWADPLDRATANVFGSFDDRGIVPIGYAAFAFALGVTAGVLGRRTLPAMAVTLFVFVAVRISVNQLVRPHLMTPVLRDSPLDPGSTGYGSAGFLPVPGPGNLQPAPPDIPNAWITSTRVVDGAGHDLTHRYLASVCPTLGHGGPPTGGGPTHGEAPEQVRQALHNCVATVGLTYHEAVTYQPGRRYWTFQWYEMGLYLAAALLLSGVCLWSVRRRAA